MTKEEKVKDLLKLHDILDKHSEDIENALSVFKFGQEGIFLNDEYEWIESKFNKPENEIEYSIFDMLCNKDVESLVKYIKED